MRIKIGDRAAKSISNAGQPGRGPICYERRGKSFLDSIETNTINQRCSDIPASNTYTELEGEHSLTVRSTHWLFAVSFFILVFSSLPILIAHPRFYWGETGTLGTKPLFLLPLPLWIGRSGWGRSLHFLGAWFALFAGMVYVVSGVFSGHFLRHMIPARYDWKQFKQVLTEHLRDNRAALQSSLRYNVIQRIAYLFVIFALFPFILLTGLAMSPAITSVFPSLVEVFGGHQSARTLHFIFSQLLVAFFVVHVVMVVRAGFMFRTRRMIAGSSSPKKYSESTAASSPVPERATHV